MLGLWPVFTVLAAAGQTARNAMQRELTASLGAAGATHVRFLFGFPFALIFFAIACATGTKIPVVSAGFCGWILAGALTQIIATALMLMAMTERSFVVTIAYLKTEPILVALFGLIVLGDALSLPASAAIMVATAGVFVMSFCPSHGGKMPAHTWRPIAMGLASAALFAISVVAYRGAILSLHGASLAMTTSFSLMVVLGLQASLLSLYLHWRQPGVMAAIIGQWRPSLMAGFMGAAATQLWFFAFALTSAANVRTLALIEVLFAQGATHFIFKQKTTAREAIGIVLIAVGCAALVWTET
ncbi:MAG: DMT family transporter [Rhizomicrobium sp.]